MKITAKFNDWVELPSMTGTIQPIKGNVELETGEVKPEIFGEGVIVKTSEKQSFDSTQKMWVRAVGTEDVICNYGGF